MQLRDYQQESIDGLFAWWDKHPAISDIPVVVLPTGAGKSIVIAEQTRRLFELWPEDHPRTLVIVPSKELAEQNAEKLAAILPPGISIGYYSASVGRKEPTSDVIVATIGTVARAAHLLGNIRCVLVDECHLISSDGAGMYRAFLRDLARYCVFRVAGFTATPFRGNGVWLTDGKAPLFTGIAVNISITRLLDEGYLSPLVRPSDVLTEIDVEGIKTTSGDYNIGELSGRVGQYLYSAASDAVRIAKDRKKWIAFCPTVANALELAKILNGLGIVSLVVTGDTPKAEREAYIGRFRSGQVRCLVTVLALATGFDVPDVDCILWLRPTKSPVLYVQGAGRGLRIAVGKSDCLWLDFSDTTSRLGPIDTITGRRKGPPKSAEAPFAVCDNCGAQVRPASALVCPECGHIMREEEPEKARHASNAAVLSRQVKQKINVYPIDRITYAKHEKAGGTPSLRAEYWSGLRVVAREWVCLSHHGFAREKALNWWAKRSPDGFAYLPGNVEQALEWIEAGFVLCQPKSITVNESAKYPEIVSYDFDGTESQEGSAEPHAAAA